MPVSKSDMDDIDYSMHDLAKLAILADALRMGIESAHKQYERALSHRLEELQQIEQELDQAALSQDMNIEQYRRLCRSLYGRVARLRGVKKPTP